MVVVAILGVSGKTFEARGEVGKRGRRHDGEALAFAFVLVFVDCAHDRGEDARVPPAARTPKAETRAGETHTGGDTTRGGEDLLLAERERLLVLVLV